MLGNVTKPAALIADRNALGGAVAERLKDTSVMPMQIRQAHQIAQNKI